MQFFLFIQEFLGKVRALDLPVVIDAVSDYSG